MVSNRRKQNGHSIVWIEQREVISLAYSSVTPNLQKTPGYEQARNAIGAPKLFYDDATQYILTWHTPHKQGVGGR
jgi:hypothetical protein